MNGRRDKKWKIEWLIAFGMLLAACIAAAAFRWMPGKEKIKISYDGKEYGSYSLKNDRKIEIETKLGRNVVVIENGIAYMEEASCPDKICMHMNSLGIDRPGLIVCLPNKIIVELTE